MAAENYPSVNENEVSWADIDTTIILTGGKTIRTADYEGIKCNSEVKKGDVRGASGGRVVKRTTGEKTDAGSATFLRSGLRTLMRDLKDAAKTLGFVDSAGRPRLSQVAFTLNVKHSVPGDPAIYTVIMRGCTLCKVDMSMAVGPDADKVELDLNPIEVSWLVDGEECVLL